MRRAWTVSGFLAIVCVMVNGKVFFKEEFNNGDRALDRWVMSTFKGKQQGKFELSYGKWTGDPQLGVGLRTTQNARFYDASARLREPFTNRDKPLVFQFTVKHEQGIDCGGGYLKLFDCSLDQTQMNGDSPYLIMFGPDICGPASKKVHVILNYRGKNHLIKKDIPAKDDVFSHLYSLTIWPDQTYEVRIDDEVVESGNLTQDWDFLPPPTISDPTATKPADWDDRDQVEDPEDVKPEDWDQPEQVPDPDAQKPDDWDERMDGEWEPPLVANPLFRGEWKPRLIDNPNYKGVWVVPEIPNPEYSADDEIYLQKEICYVGIDVWQVKSGSIFDNIILTDDPDFAREYGQEMWGVMRDGEKQAKEEYEAKQKAKEAAADRKEKDDTEKDNQNIDDSDDNDHDEL